MVAKSFIFGGNTGETPETLKRKRAMAEALSQSRMPKNVGEGLTEVGNAIAYRMALADLASGEAMGQQKASAAMSPILSAFGGGAAAFPPAPAAPETPAAPKITSNNEAVKTMLDGGTVEGTAGNARAVDRASMAGYSGDVIQQASKYGVDGSMAGKIVETANAIGADPVDLATVISYETGGTFDPTKRGPTTQYGQHRGLIQFGEPQAAKLGVDWNNPVDSQLGPKGAIAKYFKGAGYKPGMGMMDLYSAVNAGSVGRYNASDANNGGAPGTVRDKVNGQMAGHRAKAERMLAALQGQAQTQIASAPNAYAPMANSMLDIKRAEAYTGDPNEMLSYLPAKPFTGDPNSMLQNGIARPANPIDVASLDPSIGMPQQMYVGQVNPNGSIGTAVQNGQAQQPQPQQMYVGQVNPNGTIGTAVQDAPAQGAIRKAIGGMAGEQAPQQMAQNVPPMPQNEATSLDRIIGMDTPLGPQQQQPQLNVGMIMQALQEPFLNEGQRSMLNGLLQQEMQKQDPAYQLQQQQAQIGLQKDQIELKNLQNPQPKWDIVTGKDGSVFRIDPQTGKHETIYGPQAEPVKPTADIQEYEYAIKQGFQGTFQDFQLAAKKAGASQVNIDQKAEGAFDKKLAEQQATTFDTMATDGMNAKSELAVIGELNTLLQGQGGTLTGMSGALARYGIGGEGVGDLQAADALINKLIPSQRQAGSGSMSDRDVEMFKASLPSLWKTPDGNKTILNTMTGLAQYKQAQGDIAQRVMIGEIDRQTAVKLLRELPNPLAAFGEQDKKPAPNSGPAGNLKSKYGLE